MESRITPLSPKNKDYSCAVGIGLFAYGMSILNLIVNTPDISNDSIMYLNVIRGIDNQSISTTHIVPLYLYIVLHAADFFHISYLYAGIALNIISQSLTAVCCYLLVRILSGKIEPGIWAGLLVSFHPGMIAFSNDFLRESFFLFLVSLFLLALVCAVKFSSVVAWYVAGISNMFVVFTRYEGGELIAFAFLGLIMSLLLKTSIKKASLFLFAFLFGLTCAFMLLVIFGVPITFLTSMSSHIISHWRT